MRASRKRWYLVDNRLLSDRVYAVFCSNYFSAVSTVRRKLAGKTRSSDRIADVTEYWRCTKEIA